MQKNKENGKQRFSVGLLYEPFGGRQQRHGVGLII